MHVLSLRLDEAQFTDLKAVARADAQSLSATIRRAIDVYIATRREDAEFQARLRRLLEENREALERLGS